MDYNLAVRSDHWRVMAVLLAEAPPDETDAGLLLGNAAAEGSMACLELLLFWGVAVDARNNEGRTALHLAAINGRIEAVRLLLAKQARPSIYTYHKDMFMIV